MDLNPIYSVDDESLKAMRGKDGLFKMDALNILPEDKNGFLAGDLRFGQTPQLACMHSLFYRLHNSIAKQFITLNPKWGKEKRFQETRRIVKAIYQRIIYKQWLPLVLGWCNLSISCVTLIIQSKFNQFYL